MRDKLKYLATWPISPRNFAAIVFVLRALKFLRSPTPRQEQRVERILVSHPYSSVGDLVLLLPLLERLRSEWPDAKMDVVVGSNACDLLDGVSGINRVFVCGSQGARVRLFGYYRRFFRNLLLYRRELMAFEYDLAIAPRWGSIMTAEAVYLVYLTGAPQRIGYSASVDGGDLARDQLFTRAVSGGQNEHESTRNLKLLDRAELTDQVLGGVTVDRRIDSLVALAGRGGTEWHVSGDLPNVLSLSEPFAVVSPGATRPFNRWPVAMLASVIREVHERTGLRFFIVGGSQDAGLCNQLTQLTPKCARSLAGATSLRQLTFLLSRAALFIGMDSGTSHVAGGVGTPTLVITPFPSSCMDEHPNSPVRFRPCGPRVRVLQPSHPVSPCFPNCAFPRAHCILQVKVDDVNSAALELLRTVRNDGYPLVEGKN